MFSRRRCIHHSAIGCVETAVPGKWGYRCTEWADRNFPKVLLITMNDGIDPASGKRCTRSVILKTWRKLLLSCKRLGTDFCATWLVWVSSWKSLPTSRKRHQIFLLSFDRRLYRSQRVIWKKAELSMTIFLVSKSVLPIYQTFTSSNQEASLWRSKTDSSELGSGCLGL